VSGRSSVKVKRRHDGGGKFEKTLFSFSCCRRTVDPRKVKDPKEIPYMQRPGGTADDSDIKPNGGFSLFGTKKTAAPEKAAPSPAKKKTSWWTL
jgi:hypothetical protein